MYQDDLNQQMQALGLIGDYESTQYNRYLDELNQWQGDRDFAYNQFWDNWNRDYTLNRDEVEDARYEEETNYFQDFERASNYAAATGDYSLFVDMGYYTPEQAENLRNAWLRQNVASSSGSGAGGGSGGSSSSKKTKSGGGGINDRDKEPTTYTVRNQVDEREGGTDWVRVAGFSRMTWDELEKKVARGEIKEIIDKDTGTIYYKKA